MEDARRDRLLVRLTLCALAWVVLHAVTAVRNFILLLDCAFSGFDALSALLGGAYLAGLLGTGWLTYAAGSRTAAGVFLKFWAVCGLLTAGMALVGEGPPANLLLLPFGLLTPWFPLSWLREWMEVPALHGAAFLLCLGEFLYYAWVRRRVDRKGESHGPVGPGTGTVEAGR